MSSINGQACYANFAVFYTASPISLLYGAYYYGWLFIEIFLAWHYDKKYQKKTRRS